MIGWEIYLAFSGWSRVGREGLVGDLEEAGRHHVLTILAHYFRGCGLAFQAGHCEVSAVVLCHIWSGHCPLGYSVSQREQ